MKCRKPYNFHKIIWKWVKDEWQFIHWHANTLISSPQRLFFSSFNHLSSADCPRSKFFLMHLIQWVRFVWPTNEKIKTKSTQTSSNDVTEIEAESYSLQCTQILVLEISFSIFFSDDFVNCVWRKKCKFLLMTHFGCLIFRQEHLRRILFLQVRAHRSIKLSMKCAKADDVTVDKLSVWSDAWIFFLLFVQFFGNNFVVVFWWIRNSSVIRMNNIRVLFSVPHFGLVDTFVTSAHVPLIVQKNSFVVVGYSFFYIIFGLNGEHAHAMFNRFDFILFFDFIFVVLLFCILNAAIKTQICDDCIRNRSRWIFYDSEWFKNSSFDGSIVVIYFWCFSYSKTKTKRCKINFETTETDSNLNVWMVWQRATGEEWMKR